VGVGLAVVAALLWARDRSLRVTLVTLAPCLVAAALTLALLSLMGIPLNLLHLLGVLLVLSIGVDYAIFLVASGPEAGTRAATLLGLCLACASTCLAFGPGPAGPRLVDLDRCSAEPRDGAHGPATARAA